MMCPWVHSTVSRTRRTKREKMEERRRGFGKVYFFANSKRYIRYKVFRLGIITYITLLNKIIFSSFSSFQEPKRWERCIFGREFCLISKKDKGHLLHSTACTGKMPSPIFLSIQKKSINVINNKIIIW